MRLNLDPMPALRKAAVDKINEHYLGRLGGGLPWTTAHRRKAEHARAALAGDIAPTFVAEAELRGMTVGDFAHLVLAKAAKDDGWDAAELERQRALLAVDAAQTPAEIDAILANK